MRPLAPLQTSKDQMFQDYNIQLGRFVKFGTFRLANRPRLRLHARVGC